MHCETNEGHTQSICQRQRAYMTGSTDNISPHLSSSAIIRFDLPPIKWRDKTEKNSLHLIAYNFYTYFFTLSLYFYFAALNGAEEVLIKRARHVVTEIKRTYEAAEALRGRDFKKVCEC